MPERSKVTRELVINNKLGLHARPASLFVETAARFSCDITIAKDGDVSDGKSILGVLMLAAGPGARIRVTASGEDAQEAVDALEQLVSDGFGEE